MSNCPGCELLPGPIPTTGTLCLWPPLGHTLHKLRAGLSESGVVINSPSPDCLIVGVSAALFPTLCQVVEKELSAVERGDCKYLLLPNGGQPALSDFGRVNSLTHLLSHITGRWLVEMLAERRLMTLFQPIVKTDEPEEVFAYECLLRGVERDGSLVGPDKLFETGRQSNLLYHLDRGARLQHIAAARHQQLRTKIFINFNPVSIYDPAFCLKSTIAAIHDSEMAPENFVFEVVESDRVSDVTRLPAILDYYRNAGFRVALDDVGAGYSSLNLLNTLRPDFIKLDMHLIRSIDTDPYKGKIAGKLIELAHSLNIQVIVEGVETVGEWNWADAHGADFTQGYLFGKPTAEPQPSCAAESVLV